VNANWEGKPKYSEKTCRSATLSTIGITWPHLGSNQGRRGGKAGTNFLNYATTDALDIHSGSSLFEFRPGHRLSWLKQLVISRSSSREISK
jgi:hypothetical protein